MRLVRRRFLQLAGGVIVLPAISPITLAQTAQGAPKLTQLLKADLQSQGQSVQETVVNLLEMGPAIAAIIRGKGASPENSPPVAAWSTMYWSTSV
jgi:hypothetical protein